MRWRGALPFSGRGASDSYFQDTKMGKALMLMQTWLSPFSFYGLLSDALLYVPDERSQSEHFVVLVNLMESF